MKKAAVPLILLLVLLTLSSAVFAGTAAATGTVTVLPTKHGTIVPSTGTAAEGVLVTLTVDPDAGYRLAEGSITLDGQPLYGTTFAMPAGGTATISATFERIPLPWWAVTFMVVAGLALLVVAWILAARSRKKAREKKAHVLSKARAPSAKSRPKTHLAPKPAPKPTPTPKKKP